jgi:DNA-binding MarR family transcriptional regulator
MGELAAEVVAISRTGLTRLVDRLEAADLVQREPSPGDRRGTIVAITPAGSELLRRMWPIYAGEIRRSFVGALEEDQVASLREALARVQAAAREPAADASR